MLFSGLARALKCASHYDHPRAPRAPWLERVLQMLLGCDGHEFNQNTEFRRASAQNGCLLDERHAFMQRLLQGS